MFENGLFDSRVYAGVPGATTDALNSWGMNIDAKVSKSLVGLIRNLLKEEMKFNWNKLSNDFFETCLKSSKLCCQRGSTTRGVLRWSGYSVVPVPFRLAGSLRVSKEGMAVFVLGRASSPVPSSVEVGQ